MRGWILELMMDTRVLAMMTSRLAWLHENGSKLWR